MDERADDNRNANPSPGSALWWYVWSVAVAGFAVVASVAANLRHDDVLRVLHDPACCLVMVSVVLTVLRPVVPGGRPNDGAFADVVFFYALLMRVGFATAVVLGVLTMLIRGRVFGEAWHRNLFNTAQHVLTLGGTWLVLRAFGIDATARHPWSFSEPHLRPIELLAVLVAGATYLAVNNCAVYVAVALIERRSFVRLVIDDLRQLGFAALALMSLSPLVLITMVHVWPLVPLFYPALVALHTTAALSVEREHDALHDALTGLGNRQLLLRDGTKALANTLRGGDALAIFLLDLDNLKEVNDSLGHAAGDRLLQVAAERLAAAVRPDDLVVRLGGDEFVVLLPGVTDAAQARLAAVRLLERVAGPCRIDDHDVELAASLGVAMAPAHAADLDQLLRCADHAMYIAKDSGCGVVLFEPHRDRAARSAGPRRRDSEEGRQPALG